MGSSFAALAKQVVDKAQGLGASHSEAFLIKSKDLSIDVREGSVETLKLAEDRGLGLRVFRDGRIGFAYTSDLGNAAVDEIVRQALANSDKTSPDDFNIMPAPGGSYNEMDLFDPRIQQVSVDEKIEIARRIEKSAAGFDNRITITERSSYFDAEYEVILANSLGIMTSYQGAYCGCYADLVAEEDGDNQTGFALKIGLKFNDLDPEKIGEEAARKAVRKLGAKSINTQKAVIVFDPHIGTSFLGIVAPALSAEAVQKGKSLFAGKVGQKISSDKVTITDHGAMPGGIASAPFDGEGVPTGKTVLIQNGELKGYLHNTYTAAKDKVWSTGNGIRNSFKSTPEVGTTNFYIEPGTTHPDDLIKDITSGLYVTDVMGMHTANPISGDFSVGASGIWIENGRFTKPVRGVAIAGNILDLLNEVEEVGSDLTFFGGKGSPTIRVSQMMISGS
ncbi:TldD/PmbA family protein [Phosphitispora fastidiosa]|uniref:TldD/PmbA family protein n=1 Tax=Phosphitispora fastidiosa TaxID=2837202 RepID=UPI001E57AE31|nr:TldD/PmbA family protein [Phosphitispora fastidiosa]MBU7007621.1 PmbA protein [Phosphitispora fastidiosa]